MACKRTPGVVCSLIAALFLAGCSIQNYAVGKLSDALAASGTTFASDDDPELIAGALPFSLKLVESLLAENPRHRGLLLAASSGFTQYAYAFVQQPADEAEDEDFEEAQRIRARARKLYLRARDYGVRGLELRQPSLRAALAGDPRAAMANFGRDDVPLLYWTAASWGSAIALSKDDPELLADQPIVEAMIDRALALDESWGDGAIHGFLIAYEPVRPLGEGDKYARSRRHFERAVALSGGQRASPYVSLAENVAVAQQNAGEFEALLERALAVDPNARPEWRLENTIMQRRAAWLRARAESLFLADEPESEPETDTPTEERPPEEPPR